MQDRSQAPHGAKDPKTQEILENHRQLRGILKHIRAANSFAEVKDRLTPLCEALTEHFRHEEEPEGVFATIEEREPRYHTQVEKLREDHANLTQELRTLCQDAAACEDSEQTQVWERAVAFATHLHDHEDRETELFIKSWNNDLGALD